MLSPAAMISSLRLTCLAALAAALPARETVACAVLNVTTGATVLVGRNHDGLDETRSGPVRVRYLLEFVPAAEGRRGAVLATAVRDGRHLVLEGMNEAGLYVGAAATPPVRVTRDPRKLPATSSDLVRALLERSATVEQAIALARRHSLEEPAPSPYGSHFMVVEPSGGAAVLEYVGDELRVVRKRGRHQHMTNAHLTPVELRARPFWASDHRFARARRLLAAGGGRTEEGVFSILRALVMSEVSWATQYALVYDLRARTLALAPDRRWGEVTTFQLDRELSRGLHSIAARAPGAPVVQIELAGPAVWGAEVVTSVDGELYRHSPGGASQQLTALGPDVDATCGEDGRLAFTRLLATGTSGGDGGRAALHTVRADGTELRQLTDGASADRGPIWSRQAAGALYFNRRTARGRWEIHRTRADARPGDEQRISDRDFGERLFTLLRDGRLLVESDRDPGSPLYALTPRPFQGASRYARLEVRFPLAGRLVALALSPDETQALLTVAADGRPGAEERGQAFYLARFDARDLVLSDARPLERAPEHLASARFGPDGRSVFYLSDRSGRSQLYRRDLDAANEVRVTGGDAAQQGFCLPGVIP